MHSTLLCVQIWYPPPPPPHSTTSLSECVKREETYQRIRLTELRDKTVVQRSILRSSCTLFIYIYICHYIYFIRRLISSDSWHIFLCPILWCVFYLPETICRQYSFCVDCFRNSTPKTLILTFTTNHRTSCGYVWNPVLTKGTLSRWVRRELWGKKRRQSLSAIHVTALLQLAITSVSAKVQAGFKCPIKLQFVYFLTIPISQKWQHRLKAPFVRKVSRLQSSAIHFVCKQKTRGHCVWCRLFLTGRELVSLIYSLPFSRLRCACI